MIVEFDGKKPIVEEKVFIAKNAYIIGDVRLRKNSNIWFGAILRGDLNYIEIGENTNVQDNSVFHVTEELPVIVGNEVTIGHNAIVHGCTIDEGSLIGMGSIVLDGAKIGRFSVVAAGSVVLKNVEIPDRVLVAGIPAKIKREITDKEIEFIRLHTLEYVKLAGRYR